MGASVATDEAGRDDISRDISDESRAAGLESDDPLCVVENVLTDEVLAHFRGHAASCCVLALTRSGSHLSFACGLDGRCWAHDAALDFADAALWLRSEAAGPEGGTHVAGVAATALAPA